MLHFPSSSTSLPRRSDSLNATQTRSSSGSTSKNDALLLKVHEELHDIRRVESHGQEDDLRMALGVVIKRVEDLATLLKETFKAQAEMEVQLNVARSNLKLVISNNEMLEEALKMQQGAGAKDVGWRRSQQQSLGQQGRSSMSSDHSPTSPSGSVPGSPLQQHPMVNMAAGNTHPYFTSTAPSPSPVTAPPTESRFFKFRFSSGSSSNGVSSPGPGSRPETPVSATPKHMASTSTSSLHSTSSAADERLEKEKLETEKERQEKEQLRKELVKEREARLKVVEDKKALEEELESLSQALFEEANKMVATERIKRAETEEELKEAMKQKDALKSALRVVEGEIEAMRSLNGSVVGTPSGGGVTSPGSSSSADEVQEVEDILQTEEQVSLHQHRPYHLRSASEVGIRGLSPERERDDPDLETVEEEADRTVVLEPEVESWTAKSRKTDEEVNQPPALAGSDSGATASSSHPGSAPSTASSDASTFTITPQSLTSTSTAPASSHSTPGLGFDEPSPWADAPSSASLPSSPRLVSAPKREDSNSFYAAAYLRMS
ncbi:hypothetical protein PM082_000516 [Marasmius tenuissimus]|nr:hypothetical protein PM082_000516 [Marasmius tenuissimus]